MNKEHLSNPWDHEHSETKQNEEIEERGKRETKSACWSRKMIGARAKDKERPTVKEKGACTKNKFQAFC